MTPIVFIILLTVGFEDGAKDKDNYQYWQRPALVDGVTFDTLDACNRERDYEIRRFRAAYTVIARYTDAKYRMRDISAICVGKSPDDPLPVINGP